MKVVVEIDPAENEVETARLLRYAASELWSMHCHGELTDLAGQQVGYWRIVNDEVAPVRWLGNGG